MVHLDPVDAVEAKRRKRERDQAGDPLPRRDPPALAHQAPHLAHRSDQHAAPPRHRIVQLAAHRHDRLDGAGKGPGVAAGLGDELAEARRVQVQALDVHQDLGVGDPWVGIEPPRRLRKGAVAVEHPVKAVASRQAEGHVA